MKPCGCCKHDEDGNGDMECLRCLHNAPDNFEPVDGCETCRFDPRKHGICRTCVDHDKHQPNAQISGGTPSAESDCSQEVGNA